MCAFIYVIQYIVDIYAIQYIVSGNREISLRETEEGIVNGRYLGDRL